MNVYIITADTILGDQTFLFHVQFRTMNYYRKNSTRYIKINKRKCVCKIATNLVCLFGATV